MTNTPSKRRTARSTRTTARTYNKVTRGQQLRLMTRPGESFPLESLGPVTEEEWDSLGLSPEQVNLLKRSRPTRTQLRVIHLEDPDLGDSLMDLHEHSLAESTRLSDPDLRDRNLDAQLGRLWFELQSFHMRAVRQATNRINYLKRLESGGKSKAQVESEDLLSRLEAIGETIESYEAGTDSASSRDEEFERERVAGLFYDHPKDEDGEGGVAGVSGTSKGVTHDD